MHKLIAPLLVLCITACAPAAPTRTADQLRGAAPAPRPEAALAGRTVADALATMRADRFACALEYRPLDAELDRKPRAGRPARAVILSCSRWDPSPERPCIEERVVFDIEWPDPQGDPLDQLSTAHVVGQAFRCSPNWNRPAPK